jgi:hypothetical protein
VQDNCDQAGERRSSFQRANPKLRLCCCAARSIPGTGRWTPILFTRLQRNTCETIIAWKSLTVVLIQGGIEDYIGHSIIHGFGIAMIVRHTNGQCIVLHPKTARRAHSARVSEALGCAQRPPTSSHKSSRSPISMRRQRDSDSSVSLTWPC